MEGSSHKRVDKGEVAVVRKEYGNGTVSFDQFPDGVPVRLTFRKNGAVRLHVIGKVVGVVGVRSGEQEGTTIDIE